MSSNYPGALDSFTNPTQTDRHDTSGVEHWVQHTNINDAMEAVQAELGTDPANGYADVAAAIAAALAGGSSGVEDVNTVAASGSTETIPDTSSYQINYVTLTADCTLTFPTASAGKFFSLLLSQDSTGNWDVVWPSNIIWVDGVEHVMTQGKNVSDLIRFVCMDGTNWVGYVLGERLSADAPPQVVQYKIGGASGGLTATAATVVMDATPVQGNTLIAFLHSVGSREGSATSGSWTEQYDTVATDGTSLQCFTHTVGSSETNSYDFSWTDTAEYNSVIVVEVSGSLGVDQIATSVTGNSSAPSGTNTYHPDLVFLHTGTDAGAAAGSNLAFNANQWTTLVTHFPSYHANAVAYRYEYDTTWPTVGSVQRIAATDIPRAVISLRST